MALIKTLLLILLLIAFLSISLLIQGIAWVTQSSSRPQLMKLISLISQAMLKVMSVKFLTVGKVPRAYSGKLVVANHMGYLDILALSSIAPTCFVTSHELRETPLLGPIVQAGGCLFVNRLNRKKIHYEIQSLADALKNKDNITLFPEAKSTNGDEVIPFKRSLFEAAIMAKANVVPVTINYESVSGQAVNLKNRDLLCWYDDTSFLTHFWRFIKHNKIVIKVEFHPEIEPAKLSSKELSMASYEQVKKSFRSFK